MGVPKSPAHVILGDYLRTVREAAGMVQRDMPFSPGHVSAVENGCVTPSEEILAEYVNIGGSFKIISTLYSLVQMAVKKNKRQQRHKQRHPGKAREEAATSILEGLQESLAQTSSRLGGFSKISFALATELQARTARREAQLDTEEKSLTDLVLTQLPEVNEDPFAKEPLSALLEVGFEPDPE